jgi:hypothetical protein
MDGGLAVLEFSHVFYFWAAIVAWRKGYILYSIILFLTVTVSMINHYVEQTNDATALEWFEKTVVIIMATYTIVAFRTKIDSISWVIFAISLVCFTIGHSTYEHQERYTYLIAHTLWHLGTGYAILRTIYNS